MANNIKNWVSLARRTVKNLKQVLDEVLVQHPVRQPVPVPVRIPVNRQSFPLRRSLHTASKPVFTKGIRPQRVTSAAFATPVMRSTMSLRFIGGKKMFPSGLYANFHGGRMYSTSAIHFTHQAVQSIHLGLRAGLSNLDDKRWTLGGSASEYIGHVISREQEARSRVTYHGNASHAETQVTFELAKKVASEETDEGCYVDFAFPHISLSIPSVSFIDDEIMGHVTHDLTVYQHQIKQTYHDLKQIYDAYGSLAISWSRERVRVYFPNCDPMKVEQLLTDLGITSGIVHAESRDNHTLVEKRASAPAAVPPPHQFSPVLSESGSNSSCGSFYFPAEDFVVLDESHLVNIPREL